MHTIKIEESFEYQLEAAKTNFQGNITALLELHQFILSKVQQSKINHKDFISIQLCEAELLTEHLLNTIRDIMHHYDTMSAANKILNKRQRINDRILLCQKELLEKHLAS
jgi:hypothetical protein